jgi:preprotein translocase subunit SecG
LSNEIRKTKILVFWFLFTALALNRLTHKYYTTISVINDKITRTKLIQQNNQKQKKPI